MKLPTKWLLSGLLVAALGVQAAGSDKPVVPHLDKRPFPSVRLADRQSSGQRAVDLLGTRLPEVAAWYRQSPDQFKAMMLNDKRLRLDQGGRVFVVEELQQPLTTPITLRSAATRTATVAAGTAADSLLDGTLLPDAETFLLHSRPGAPRTIYLNFKGATLTGTAWNANSNGGGAVITALPFDTDGVPGTFSSAELQKIQGIWQRVAEDFAAFDVDVTTEAPTADRLTRTSTSDTTFGTTALITNNTGVYTCSCGGVAYLNAFDDTTEYNKPALVFHNKLLNSEKSIAEAISHEVGHNLGLSHDGTASVGYYQGHGSGATGWAPIMGVGYSKLLVQWSKGEYAGANNTQDDYAVMQATGLPLRTDDHGDTIATATVPAGTSSGGITTVTTHGVIERPTDVDMFSFTVGAGSMNVTLTPAARSANLDALVTLRNSAGTALATSNPVDALNASIAYTVTAPGTYYVSVQGTGKGDPLGTGYSNYGSLGQYVLNVTHYTPSSNLSPTAVISATPTSGNTPLTVAFSGAGSTDPDGSIASWNWNFGDGSTGSGASISHLYSTAGSYSAQLTVIDNGGASASTTTTITVGPALVPMSVNSITLMLRQVQVRSITGGTNRLSTASTSAVATVKVLDTSGQPVAGATVTGNWSGLSSQTGANGVTGSTGTVTFTSPAVASTARGTFTFTVTGITKSGYSYVPGSNVETSDSITR